MMIKQHDLYWNIQRYTIMTMEKQNEKRRKGGRGPEGEPKRYILVKIFSFEDPKGIEEAILRDFLANDENGPKIKEQKNIRDHLAYLEKKGFIKKIPLLGFSNRWIPTNNIDNFLELWLDNENKIFMRKDTPLFRKLIKTHHVQQIVRDSIVPILIDSSSSPQTSFQLEEICEWACSISPSLITHAFELIKRKLDVFQSKNKMPFE